MQSNKEKLVAASNHSGQRVVWGMVSGKARDVLAKVMVLPGLTEVSLENNAKPIHSPRL